MKRHADAGAALPDLMRQNRHKSTQVRSPISASPTYGATTSPNGCSRTARWPPNEVAGRVGVRAAGEAVSAGPPAEPTESHE